MIKLNNSFLGFTDNMKGIKTVKTENTLNNLIRYNGTVLTQKDWIFQLLQNGYTPKVEEDYSYYSQKKQAYTKPKNLYMLEKEGSFYEVSKTAYEFAKYLIENNLIDIEKAKRYIEREKKQKEELERLKREQEEKEKRDREEQARIRREKEERERQEKIKNWIETGKKYMTEEVKNTITATIEKHWEEIKLIFPSVDKENFTNDCINKFTQFLGNKEFIKSNVHYLILDDINKNNLNNKIMKEIYINLFKLTDQDDKRTLTNKIKAFYNGKEYKQREQTKEVFYIRTKQGFEKRRGWRLIIDNIICFVHIEEGLYQVTEAKTGMKITSDSSKKEVIRKAKQLIEQNKNKIDSLIQKAIDQFGLSPLCQDNEKWLIF